MKATIHQIAMDVAALLGESLSLQCLPEESPFPGIEDRVRILAPGILQNLLMAPDVAIDLNGSIEVSESLYNKLLLRLMKLIKD